MGAVVVALAKLAAIRFIGGQLDQQASSLNTRPTATLGQCARSVPQRRNHTSITVDSSTLTVSVHACHLRPKRFAADQITSKSYARPHCQLAKVDIIQQSHGRTRAASKGLPRQLQLQLRLQLQAHVHTVEAPNSKTYERVSARLLASR